MQILTNYTENHLSSNFEDPWKHLVVKNNLYRWKTSYAKLKNVCFWCDVLSPCDNGSCKLPSIDAAEFGNSAERSLGILGCLSWIVPLGVPMLALLRVLCAWGMFVIATRFYVENVWRLCCTLSCVMYRFIIRFIVALPVEPWLLCAAMWKNVLVFKELGLQTPILF